MTKFKADPFDELAIKRSSFSVIVGALVPYIKFMMKNGLDFRILELDKSALKGDELKLFIPQECALDAIRAADNLIITGVTLLNDTLEEILSLKKGGAEVIVVGPTVSMSPKTLFDRCGRRLYYECRRAFGRDRAGWFGVSFFRQICGKIRNESR